MKHTGSRMDDVVLDEFKVKLLIDKLNKTTSNTERLAAMQKMGRSRSEW